MKQTTKIAPIFGETPQKKSTTISKESNLPNHCSPLPEACPSSPDHGNPFPLHPAPLSVWSMAMATTSAGPSKPLQFSLPRWVSPASPLTFKAMANQKASRPTSPTSTLWLKIASPSSIQSSRTFPSMDCLQFCTGNRWAALSVC